MGWLFTLLDDHPGEILIAGDSLAATGDGFQIPLLVPRHGFSTREP